MTPALTQADRAALRARLLQALPPAWRTRFAPAPTGQLHLGHAVNAVYVWSIARAFGGSVIVRIEDHDERRSRAAYDASIRADLAWLGLEGDNAALAHPVVLRQSDTPDLYAADLARLAATGAHVYPCRCSRRDIAAHTDHHREPYYPGTCRRAAVLPEDTAARRLQLGDDLITFTDLRHGVQTQQPSAQCGDLLLKDRLSQWTYQFAVVADDLRQGVNVIIRGDDLLDSTGRQFMLGEALGRRLPPQVLHHPLIMHPDGTKLSKSRGDRGLAELRAAGWDAARVLGYAAWLGGLQDQPQPVPADSLGHLWNHPAISR